MKKKINKKKSIYPHKKIEIEDRGSLELKSDSDPSRQARVESRSARVHRLSFTSKSIRQHRKHREEEQSTEMEEDAEEVPPAKLKKQAG